MFKQLKNFAINSYMSLVGFYTRFRKNHSNGIELILVIIGLTLLIVLGFAALIGLFFLILLPFYFIAWEVWIHIVPLIFPNADPAITHPGFWLFAGCIFLINFIRGLIFGSRDTTVKVEKD